MKICSSSNDVRHGQCLSTTAPPADPQVVVLTPTPNTSTLATPIADTSTTTPNTTVSTATPLPAWTLAPVEVPRPVSVPSYLKHSALPTDGWLRIDGFFLPYAVPADLHRDDFVSTAVHLHCRERQWVQEPQLQVLPEFQGLMLYTEDGPMQFRANYRYDWAALVTTMSALRDLVLRSPARYKCISEIRSYASRDPIADTAPAFRNTVWQCVSDLACENGHDVSVVPAEI